eukprot:472260_1
MTRFCTAFRKTFRRINETKDEEVVERHLYLYFYARALYEAVDFFGREMDVDLKVYHGLDEVMYFQKFKTYFNQPMSTTPSKHAARNFAKTSGIILTLISGSEFGTKASKIPKYLPIAWLSDFPNEEELLFYGNNVIFRIHNITESANLKEHTKELLILNKLQKIVQNQSVSWQQESKTTISGLEELITNQNLINKGNKETVQYKIMTKYCQDLFSHFCNHPNTTVIGIDNYMLLPEKIKIALGIANPDDNTKLCLILLINLFQNLIELKLNNLRLEDMLIDKQVYIDAVLNYIRENETFSNNLIRISFQSEPQRDRKDNSALKNLVNKKLQQFAHYAWTIKYIFDETNSLTHSLLFEKKHKNITTSESLRNPNQSVSKISTEYPSNPSETIFIHPPTPQIKSWNEYPNLLQILSVDDQEIQIKFTLKITPNDKTRCQIQNTDKSEQKLSQLLTIRSGNTVIKDVTINSNTSCIFAIFLNGKQISNVVSVKTPIDSNPNNNYIPQSPLIDTIEKYYDEDKRNILLVWDYPNSVFGDKIIYKIKSSNKIESEEIVYLPYKISNTSNVHIEITTIAIINNKRYEGKTSTKCSVLAREPSQRQLDHVQPETESKYVERLLSVVQQYALLNNNPHTNKELIEFMENTNYEQILNDYTHVISKHNERQKSIKSKCNLYKCSILKRYYFNSDTNTSDHKQEEDFMFYTELLDSIHCYLYHLQDLGQRFSITDQETITGGGDSAA